MVTAKPLHGSNPQPLPSSLSPPRIANSYGSINSASKPPLFQKKKTTTFSDKVETIPDDYSSRAKPAGPLARVSSQPTFVPLMQIDFDAVAEQVSEQVGGSFTTEELLSSLEDSNNTHSDAHHEDIDPFDEPEPLDHPALQVVVADKDDKQDFSDEALVLKIRSQDTYLPESNAAFVEEHTDRQDTEQDSNSGFAINIPVSNDDNVDVLPTASSWTQYNATSWTSRSTFRESDNILDEENPLLPQTPGIDLSYVDSDGSAIVQRQGPRNEAEKQEVIYAVPNADNLSNRTGLFIPVVDSRDDLRQLMLVVPPEESLPDDMAKDQVETQSTAKATREYIESITNMIPPIVDVESTLEVHGTVENATVAVNVTQQVSWVGYFILFIALASVASQGTAVKWLPSVDGMIAAAWMMQAQTCLMLPVAVFQAMAMNREEKTALRNPSTLMLIVAASVAQVCWASGFFLAIDFTSLFHAWSLNNIHALAIVVITAGRMTLFKEKDLRLSSEEEHGARVAIFGVLVMQVPALLSGNGKVLFGDTIAAMSSLGAIVFLDLCKELRSRIPLFVMMAPISALNSILFSFASMAISGTDFSVSDSGAFGWIKSDRIFLGLYLGGVVGLLGTVSCIAALKFLPNVVVGSVQTMMPVVGTIVAILVGVDTLPDFWSTCGGGILLYGVLLIADATRQNETTVVINSHISEVTPTPSKAIAT